MPLASPPEKMTIRLPSKQRLHDVAHALGLSVFVGILAFS